MEKKNMITKVNDAFYKVEKTITWIAFAIMLGLLLIQVFCRGGCRDIRMRFHTFLKVLPHVQYDSFMVPPIKISFLAFFPIRFPSFHNV